MVQYADMNAPDNTTATTTTSTTTTWPTHDCPNRLACGLCLILNRDCPKMGNVFPARSPWDGPITYCNTTASERNTLYEEKG